MAGRPSAYILGVSEAQKTSFRKKGVALGDTAVLGAVFLEGLAGKP